MKSSALLGAMRSGYWGRKKIIEDFFGAKNGTSKFGFDSVLKLKTDAKWSLGRKKNGRNMFWSKNSTSMFGFDAV